MDQFALHKSANQEIKTESLWQAVNQAANFRPQGRHHVRGMA